MPFAVIRLFVCASLFLVVSELNSQTITPQNGATISGRQGSSNHGSSDRGSWKVLYEENFEDGAALFKTGSPAWVSDSYQNTDEFSDGGAHFRQLGVKPPVAFRAEGSFRKRRLAWCRSLQSLESHKIQ